MKKTGKQKLVELENENKYVFHGSGFIIEEFEPRQAHNFIEGQQISDGERAVFTSQYADYAVFMALVNEVNCPKGYHSGVSFDNGELVFRATKETLKQLEDETEGYVYVFNRTDFTKRSDNEWVSHKKIKPIFVITVTRSDFLPTIKETT